VLSFPPEFHTLIAGDRNEADKGIGLNADWDYMLLLWADHNQGYCFSLCPAQFSMPYFFTVRRFFIGASAQNGFKKSSLLHFSKSSQSQHPSMPLFLLHTITSHDEPLPPPNLQGASHFKALIVFNRESMSSYFSNLSFFVAMIFASSEK